MLPSQCWHDSDVLMPLECFVFAFAIQKLHIKMLTGLSNNVWLAGLNQLG